MRIEERSYSTKKIRPRPFISKGKDLDVIIALTTWGEGQLRDLIIDEINKFLFASQGDIEVTSPFETNTFLSRDCNLLRTAALIANDMVFRSENRDEYKSCYELVVLMKNKSRLSWLQMGQPNVYLMGQQKIVPLTTTAPLSLKPDHLNSDLLPSQFLGSEMHCQFQLGDIQIQQTDRVFLHTDYILPAEIAKDYQSSCDFNTISNKLIQFSSDRPFWCGIVDFKD